MAQKKLTNSDWIRGKFATDRGLAEFLSCTVAVLDCPRDVFDSITKGSTYEAAWLKWLKKPVKEGAKNGNKG